MDKQEVNHEDHERAREHVGKKPVDSVDSVDSVDQNLKRSRMLANADMLTMLKSMTGSRRVSTPSQAFRNP